MFLCICHAITREQVDQALRENYDVEDICRVFKVGTNCGICISEGIESLRKNKGSDGPKLPPSKEASRVA